MTLGASVALLGDGILGIEADVGHTPKFFEGDDPLGLVLSSRVTTISGNVLLAAPLALTRESLRPYLVGGLGLLQARSNNAARLFPLEEDRLGADRGRRRDRFRERAHGICGSTSGTSRPISGADGPFARDGVSTVELLAGHGRP